MPLENQAAPEKPTNSGIEKVESPQVNQEAQLLLSDSDSFNKATSSANDKLNDFPNSDNVFDMGDKETREAFGSGSGSGSEGEKGSNKTGDNVESGDESSVEAKETGDIKDPKTDTTESPKSEKSADQAIAHDVTQVDHQEGESKTDNMDVAANKDGKDKKGKTGDADKDTDDGSDNLAGETSDTPSNAFGKEMDTSIHPSVQPAMMQTSSIDQNNAKATEEITKAAGQETGTDINANAAIPILNEVSQDAAAKVGQNSTNGDGHPSSAFGMMEDTSIHPSIQPAQMQASELDQSALNLGLNTSRTEALYKKSLPLK